MADTPKMETDMLGLHVVLGLLERQSFDFLRETGFTRDHVFHDARDAYDLVVEEVGKGTWPSLSYVAKMTGSRFPPRAYSPEESAAILRRRRLTQLLGSSLRDVALDVTAHKPEVAIEKLKLVTANIEFTPTSDRPVSFRKSGESRYERYQTLKCTGGFTGYNTPWDGVNRQIQGWVDQDLVCLLGYSGSGKSWTCCYIANHLMSQGAKVLFVTMEMPITSISRRLDAVRYHIPFPAIRDGRMDDEENWLNNLRNDAEGDGDIILVEERSCKTVPDIRILVSEYQPDVVIIDGGYRLIAPGRSHWEQSSAVPRACQTAAKETDIPWLVSTQLGSSTSKRPTKEGAVITSDDVRYTKEWFTDSNVCLALQQTPTQRINNIMELHVIKSREGSGGGDTVHINWDQSAMDFSELDGSEGFSMTQELTFTV